jgi:NAD(P)-dependent dehydrogenase (short-subunit alcohol dehydrogenase family)
MKSVLVTGGSKGIGYEFVKQYLQKKWKVLTTCRVTIKSPELEMLKTKYNNQLTIIKLDVSNGESRKEFFNCVNTHVNNLDILINNAGIKSGNEKTRYKFGELNQKDLSRTYLVNSIGPLLVAQGLVSLLEKGEQPLIVNITSINGSITNKNHKQSGIEYDY